METYELECEVRAALIGNAELMSVLPCGVKSVYHYAAPATEPKSYPIIVYAPISDVPALSGDNREITHRVTIRIHVIMSQRRWDFEEEKFKKASKLVREIMTGLSFVRRQTTPYAEDGKIMSVMDFVKGIDS